MKLCVFLGIMIILSPLIPISMVYGCSREDVSVNDDEYISFIVHDLNGKKTDELKTATHPNIPCSTDNSLVRQVDEVLFWINPDGVSTEMTISDQGQFVNTDRHFSKSIRPAGELFGGYDYHASFQENYASILEISTIELEIEVVWLNTGLEQIFRINSSIFRENLVSDENVLNRNAFSYVDDVIGNNISSMTLIISVIDESHEGVGSASQTEIVKYSFENNSVLAYANYSVKVTNAYRSDQMGLTMFSGYPDENQIATRLFDGNLKEIATFNFNPNGFTTGGIYTITNPLSVGENDYEGKIEIIDLETMQSTMLEFSETYPSDTIFVNNHFMSIGSYIKNESMLVVQSLYPITILIMLVILRKQTSPLLIKV